ncbi:ribosome biogenesis protein [Candidatus Woesearchaeota archaeon]|nr:ribosome biogenesis protein [Candidatus Woesearchaeota archaeon]
MRHIMRCQGCSVYTLKEICSKPFCEKGLSKTVIPKPARYSPEDNYAAYRRKAKEGQLKAKGWL